MIVVSPNAHISGNRYEWIKDHSSFDRIPAEDQEWLLKLIEREEVLLTPFESSNITAEIKEGSRNSTLTSLAGTMSGTGSSDTGYKYKEYIKDGQRIYKITERTRVTIRINPYNRKVYTHPHMLDGKYTVRAWIEDIDLTGINNEYKKLGILRGMNSLDEIEVSG